MVMAVPVLRCLHGGCSHMSLSACILAMSCTSSAELNELFSLGQREVSRGGSRGHPPEGWPLCLGQDALPSQPSPGPRQQQSQSSPAGP